MQGHTTCFSAAQFLVRPRALAGIAPFDGDDQLRGNEYELPSRSSRRRDGALASRPSTATISCEETNTSCQVAAQGAETARWHRALRRRRSAARKRIRAAKSQLKAPRRRAGMAPFDGDDQLRGNEYELPSRSSRRRDGATSGECWSTTRPLSSPRWAGEAANKDKSGETGDGSQYGYWHESWPSRARPKGAGKEGYNKEEHSGITFPPLRLAPDRQERPKATRAEAGGRNGRASAPLGVLLPGSGCAGSVERHSKGGAPPQEPACGKGRQGPEVAAISQGISRQSRSPS